MLSAHGTAPEIENKFKTVALNNVNSVCPLVTKVHHEAKRFSEQGKEIIYIGHKNHDEALGAMGVAPDSMTLIENVKDVDKISINSDNIVNSLSVKLKIPFHNWIYL